MWRACVPRVLGALTRRYGDFALAEDSVQEALLAAATQWPVEGRPDDPEAWLTRVASRRLIDQVRSESARRDREERVAREEVEPATATRDDSLAVLLLCCDPSLTMPSRVALTLRAVAGLTTAQVASAFGVPESTIGQRVSRAKAQLRGRSFAVEDPAELPERLAAVRQVLYLLFTEGHTAIRGPALYDVSLTAEAVRLTRRLHELLPGDDETTGLLALMLLTEARRPARVSDDGALVPLADQDRSRWDRGLIDEGVALVEEVLPTGPVGPYQLQAAIAAVHAEATEWADTDWPQIAALYAMLDRLAPSDAVTLSRAVAVAMVDGPEAGLTLVEPLIETAGDHRPHAVRAHLLEEAGRLDEARAAYELAARLCQSTPEQRYLQERLARLASS